MPSSLQHRQVQDPRNLSVQISFRMPFWYKEQLADQAAGFNMTLPMFILDIVERSVEPKPPT
jgi:hypothetical protein